MQPSSDKNNKNFNQTSTILLCRSYAHVDIIISIIIISSSSSNK